MITRIMRSLLLLTLSLDLVLSPVVYAKEKIQSSGVKVETTSLTQDLDLLKNLSLNLNSDPILSEINKSADLPMEVGYKSTDLDKDPFFMRSQTWEVTQENILAKNFDVRSVNTIQIKNKIWKLNQKLSIIGIGAQNIYLAADKSIYSHKNLDQNSEGVFIIDRIELEFAAEINAPVAIYFFPLPGNGWSTQDQIKVHELSAQDTLIVHNNEDFLAIEMRDLRIVKEVEMVNLQTAQLMTMQSNPKLFTQVANDLLTTKTQKSLSTISKILPAKGATAGFGVAFTGQDLDNPRNNLFFNSESNDFESNNQNYLKDFFVAKIKNSLKAKFNNFSNLISAGLAPKQAHGEFVIATAGMAKLVYISSIVGVLFISSIVLKYTVLRTRMAEIEAYQKQMKEILAQKKNEAHKTLSEQEAFELKQTHKFAYLKYIASQRIKLTKQQLREAIDKNPRLAENIDKISKASGKQLTELRKDVDVLAHLLTVTASIASYTVATAIEYLGDKYLPGLMASDNTLIRRFLNYTVFYSRANVSNVPVNAKTLWLGSFVLGGVDTYLVHYQISTLVPMMSVGLKSVSPEFIETRIQNTFETKNELQDNITREMVVSNAAAYLRTGASKYSVTTKAQYQVPVENEVKDELMKQGINPNLPENKSKVNSLVEERLNIILKQLGLPDQNEFIIGIDSMFDNMFRRFGFRLPLDRKQAGVSYYFETRPGLATTTLKAALTMAYRLDSENSLRYGNETRQVLEQTLKDFSLARSAYIGVVNSLNEGKGPFQGTKEAIQRTLDLRRDLVLLSHSGMIDYTKPENHPKSWQEAKYSDEAKRNAAFLFRLALISTLTGDKKLLNITPEQIADIRGDAYSKSDLQRGSLDEVLKLVSDNIANENENLSKKEIAEYKFNLDDFQKKVHEKATEDALKRTTLAQFRHQHGGINDAEYQEYFLNEYRKSAAEQMGLYEDNKTDSKLLDYVEDMAIRSLDSTLKNDKKLNSYLSKLNEQEQLAIKGFYFANAWMLNYKIATVNLQKVSAISPDQPGKFQKYRRKDFVRNNQTLTRLLRLAESFFDDETYRIEKDAAKGRNIPFKYDFTIAWDRTKRSLPMALTVAYAFSYYVFNVTMPYSAFVIGVGLMFMISVPSQILNRMFRQQGIEPMGGTMQKIVFATIFSFATFWQMIPESLFAQDVENFIDKSKEIAVKMTEHKPIDSEKAKDPSRKPIKTHEVYAVVGTEYTVRIPIKKNLCEKIFSNK